MTDWVELRVHGVSGTPPESLLGTPHVTQVAGDDYSRFFRPAPEPTDHVVEAYHWGRFTSGSWRQALTLLLVPFGIANATQFMLPEPVTVVGKVLHAVAGACLRAIALVLTSLFTFALGLILIDLLGWRWADKTRLLQAYPDDLVLQVAVLLTAGGVLLLSMLGWSGTTRQPLGDPSPAEGGSGLGGSFYTVDPNAPTLRWLHVAAAFGLVALLADFTRAGNVPSSHGDTLRVVVIVAIAVVCAVVVFLGDPEKAVSVTWGKAQALPETWHTAVRRLAPVLAAGTGALVLVEVFGIDGIDRTRALRLYNFDLVADGLMYGGIGFMALLYVVVVAHLWRGDGYAWTRDDAIARLVELVPVAAVAVVTWRVGDGWVRSLAVLVLVVVAGLAVWTATRIVRPTAPAGADADHFRPYAGGMAPFLLASVAVFLGIGFSASAATAISSSLSLDVVTDPKGGAPVKAGTTPMLDRVAYAWGLTLLVVVGIVLVILVCFALRARTYRQRTEAMYAPTPTDPTTLPGEWIGRVVRATYVGQLKNFVPGIFIAFAGVGLAISAVQGYESSTCEHVRYVLTNCENAPGWLDKLSEQRGEPGSIFLINVGAWLFVAGAGAVVTISRGALKNQGLRRGINIVWDIFSFWPHAVHPFVPRPYSRWTVLELRNRIRFHLGGRAGVPPDRVEPGKPEVVVCAHSQGSLISFAAIMQLTQAERDRIAFLSCGSQLRVIYPRAFPAYVSLAGVTWLYEALDGRWINLYRLTDPLAGPVLSWKHDATGSRHFPLAPDGARTPDDQLPDDDRCRRSGNDWRLIDPVAYDLSCETGPVDAIHGHHNFWLDAAWGRALDRLRSAAPS